jgi:hypothetical protein
MQIQTVPFQPFTGPNGWALDLVPHPFVGMAAETLLYAMENPSAKPNFRAKGQPIAWSKRVGPFTIWAWADGSIVVKPLSGPAIPFPMWLHQHPTYPSHMPNHVPTGLDLGWMCSALVLNAALLHTKRYAEVASGNPFTEAYPLWWVPSKHPQAEARVWNTILDGMAEVAGAWYKAMGATAPKAICFSVSGGMVRADGRIDPARLEPECLPEGLHDPAIGYLHTRFQPLLGSLESAATAWSAEHVPVDGHPDPNHRLHVPVLMPRPITVVTRNLPMPSAHLVLEVSQSLALCTG